MQRLILVWEGGLHDGSYCRPGAARDRDHRLQIDLLVLRRDLREEAGGGRRLLGLRGRQGRRREGLVLELRRRRRLLARSLARDAVLRAEVEAEPECLHELCRLRALGEAGLRRGLRFGVEHQFLHVVMVRRHIHRCIRGGGAAIETRIE